MALWRRLQERVQAYSAQRREQDQMRMTERSTRGTTGLSTPVRPLKPYTLLCTICEEGWGWARGWWADRRMRLRSAVGAGDQCCCTSPGGSLTSSESQDDLTWRETGFLIQFILCSLWALLCFFHVC